MFHAPMYVKTIVTFSILLVAALLLENQQVFAVNNANPGTVGHLYEGGIPGYPYFGGYPNYGGFPYITGYGHPYDTSSDHSYDYGYGHPYNGDHSYDYGYGHPYNDDHSYDYGYGGYTFFHHHHHHHHHTD